ncbi:Acg family FMN-binding oxidoreductase [Nonomuraea endophytica]|uniref:Acg family FMN-binding oxidoreductase n=1 Tax=Nonomuraea endophytica TaxID=714136 RepID=UPI0037CA24F3
MQTTEDLSQVMRAAVQTATWAPSVHNSQPWSFAIARQEISLRADIDRKLKLSDPDGRQMLIGCGAALFNIRTSLRAMGYESLVKVLPDPDRPSLLAIIRPGSAVAADEETLRLSAEIERRRTHWAGFVDLPVPDRMVGKLVALAAAEGATLTPVDSGDAEQVISALTAVAQSVQSASLELIGWAQRPGSGRKDGVPADGYPTEAGRTDPQFAQRDYAHGRPWGNLADQSESTSTGIVAVLTTRADSREAWIAAGQALQGVLLHASAHGVSAAFRNQAPEMHHLREFLRQELCSGAYPQMIIRVGFTFDETTGVRRSLGDVLE